MGSNADEINNFNEMARSNHSTNDNCYFSSGRPVRVDPKIIINDINSKIEIEKNQKILDVGCGTGVITIPLSFRVKEIFALDAGIDVINKLKENFNKKNITNIKPINSSIKNSNFKSNFFDHIIMYAVIHYLDNILEVENCIKELIRVCKPGGSILIAEIPEINAIRELNEKKLTKEEIKILEEFNNNRSDYDNFMNKLIEYKGSKRNNELDGNELVQIANKYGCYAELLKQDIRQPFSLSRRDLLIKLPK